MAALLNGLFGGSQPSAAPVQAGDSDFADFAGAPDPTPAFSAVPSAAEYTGPAATPTGAAIPYTKWYNVHERHSLSEFKQEGIIFGVLMIIISIHFFGTGANRKKAKKWMNAHAPVLRTEFALVGFGGRAPTTEEIENEESARSMVKQLELPEDMLKEKSPQEYATYATGRQNVAFLDVNIKLLKRFNPILLAMEYCFSLFFDSMITPVDRMEAVLYPFDGRENLTVPGQAPGAHELRKDTKSNYDNFVWAIVNKETMKSLRDDRYDVSITSTKDSAKLPNWATVMSESAEVTDFLLTPELIKAVEMAGDLLEHLIITDQPNDQPMKLEDTVPKKRIYLSMKLPSNDDYSKVLPIFEHFLRITDQLASSAHFRPEVMRKVRQTREDTIKKLQKADEEEKAEERALEREKAKKLKRDLELKGLDAKAQKKYLEKEKEKEMRKAQKKQTQRG
ncbi:ab5ad0b2-b33c-4dc8-8d49-9078bd6ae185 [Sclerotinia trifoliorum]|uniref:Ab5ad0b2-b33c-4dc8-8d49-9078bd6ae185 n=1 Tax=Sclerotinia trifoliorum TaxID=28548 RepID=A0A8H2VZ84_9HELO|nr:ab5ad0b2-b33c-4dc8-8d49-9078bd6ae185 [Sclerotinia trifoliorum]